MSYEITDHTVMQYLKRIKPDMLKDIKRQITNIIENGTEVSRKDNAISLMNNGYREAKYYMKKSVVVVVEKDVVKTTFKYESTSKNKFKYVL